MDNTETKNGRFSPLLLFGGAILLGLAAALLLFGGDLFGNDQEAANLPQAPALSDAGTEDISEGIQQVGASAYEFTLNDLDNNAVSLSDLRGQPVMVNFWATWCAPCRLEMPEFETVYSEREENNLAILAVNLDEPADRVNAFFYDDLGLTFTPLLDEGGVVSKQYGVFTYPTTYFINAEGVVTAVHRGLLTKEQIDIYLETTIAEET